jgi:hypothetical protein
VLNEHLKLVTLLPTLALRHAISSPDACGEPTGPAAGTMSGGCDVGVLSYMKTLVLTVLVMGTQMNQRKTLIHNSHTVYEI